MTWESFTMLINESKGHYYISHEILKYILNKRPKMVEEYVEATLTSSPDQSGITTKLWRDHPE